MFLDMINIDLVPINIAVYKRDGDDFIFVDFNKKAQITENIDKSSLIGKYLTKVFPGVKKRLLIQHFTKITALVDGVKMRL